MAKAKTSSKKKSTKKKPSGKQAITADMLMGDILNQHPQAAEVLTKYGFHCIGCAISPYESLAAGATVHGIPLDPLLDELNQMAE